MYVVVTGGTGLIGRALVKRLVGAGHGVCVLTRREAHARAHLPLRCEIASWEPSEATVAAGPFVGADAVVNLAGEGIADHRWNSARKQAVLNSRVETTAAVVSTLARLPAADRPRVLLSASAVGYYGDRRGEILSEDKPRGSGFLADVCEAWEAAALRAEDLGVRTLRVRIGIVLDSYGGALARMLTPFRAGLGGPMGAGRQWMSWIHIDDLVALLIFLIENDGASGPVNAVAPTPMTNAAFTRALAAALKRRAFLRVPAPLLRLGLGEMSLLLLGSQRVQPVAAENLGFAWTYADLTAALSALCAKLGRVIEHEHYVEMHIEEAFAFFSDARNLERITPPQLRFRLVGVDPVGPVGRGTRFSYRMRVRGVSFGWRSIVTSWDPPYRFVDSQSSGPYGRWDHSHEFEEYRGGTIVRDRILYDLPFGTVGRFLAGGVVGHDLEAIFAYRRRAIDELTVSR